MTYFEIYALTAPVIGFLFLACFAGVLMRMDRYIEARETTESQAATLKQAAE
ncbi:MAG: hypothetical protein ABWY18_16665 [Tardiphaga sp.]